jgi:hypothetical protein
MFAETDKASSGCPVNPACPLIYNKRQTQQVAIESMGSLKILCAEKRDETCLHGHSPLISDRFVGQPLNNPWRHMAIPPTQIRHACNFTGDAFWIQGYGRSDTIGINIP